MHLHASLGRITNDLAFMQQQHLSLRRLMKPFEPVGEGKCRCCSMYAAKSVILSAWQTLIRQDDMVLKELQKHEFQQNMRVIQRRETRPSLSSIYHTTIRDYSYYDHGGAAFGTCVLCYPQSQASLCVLSENPQV